MNADVKLRSHRIRHRAAPCHMPHDRRGLMAPAMEQRNSCPWTNWHMTRETICNMRSDESQPWIKLLEWHSKVSMKFVGTYTPPQAANSRRRFKTSCTHKTRHFWRTISLRLSASRRQNSSEQRYSSHIMSYVVIVSHYLAAPSSSARRHRRVPRGCIRVLRCGAGSRVNAASHYVAYALRQLVVIKGNHPVFTAWKVRHWWLTGLKENLKYSVTLSYIRTFGCILSHG